MTHAPEKPYQKLLRVHQTRRIKKPEKTNDKILKAMEKVVESALKTLAAEESITPREQKEIISLLIKAAGEITKITSAQAKTFTPTQTDQALLEYYVQQRLTGTVPGTLPE